MTIARLASTFAALGLLVACTAGPADPTEGRYTVSFPSTAAAIATDFVQVLVFDVPDPATRNARCQELITQRLTTPTGLSPVVPAGPAVTLCDMAAGARSLEVPYGEHAILAIGQRQASPQAPITDFLIGCAVMTIGDGDAPLDVPLGLVSIAEGVPATTCASVGDLCANRCAP